MQETNLIPLEILSMDLGAIASQAEDYLHQAKAPNTLKAYRSDWKDFEAWCQTHGQAALPASPETVALYLSDLANRCKTSTLHRRISAISQAHQAAKFEPPTRSALVKNLWSGIRRAKGTAQAGKEPLLTPDIRVMIGSIRKGTLKSIRDRALLLLGFAGAFRRSELVSLDFEDLRFTREGLTVILRRSKTDQEGEGRKVGIPYGSCPDTCPVRALEDWLREAGIAYGSLFRPINRHGQMKGDRLTDQSVALIVKGAAEAAGLDPSHFSGHSLRAGLATQAAMAGVSERAIMAQTGHRSPMMVRRYIRDGSLFRENAAASLGL